MSELEIKVEGLESLRKRFGEGPNAVTATFHRLFRQIGRFMVPAMREEMPTGATGRLKRFTSFRIEGIRDLRLLILDGQRYGRFVRSGTRPHWPPRDALRAWVVKKLGKTGKDADRVAFLVRRKISVKGTKANPYHRRALDKKRRDIEAAAEAEGVKLVVFLAEGKK